MKILLVLPHQLFVFTRDVMKNYDQVVCIEEPILFYDVVYRPLKVHKLRIAYMRASLKAYHRLITSSLSTSSSSSSSSSSSHLPNVTYVDWVDANSFLNKLPNGVVIYMEDPVDIDIIDKYKKLFGDRLKLVDETKSKHFIISITDLQNYYKIKQRSRDGKNASNYTHVAFFNHFKQKFNVLPNVPSYDEANRQPLSKSHVDVKHKQPTYGNKGRDILKAIYHSFIS